MLNVIFENLRNLLPDKFKGDFAFYPILFLVLSFFICFLCGLICGIFYWLIDDTKKTIKHKKKLFDFDDDSGMAFIVLQTIFFICVVFSSFLYEYPSMKRPGGGLAEIGLAYAMVFMFFAMLIIGSIISIFLDALFFGLGILPGFLCNKLIGFARRFIILKKGG